jgi:hypothetical protein
VSDETREIELVLKARDLASREFDKTGSAMAGADKKAEGLGGRLGGLGKIAAGVALGGVALLVGGLVGAVKAAAEEEVGINRLDAALKANIPAWDGNRDAIEQLIAKREGLAFADDQLRDSMSVLVAGTKDVTKAQELQALAMDLARAKGVDLVTASQAIAKAAAGSTRELKALGIEVDANATAAENLATVQAAVAGQAEAYAGTTAARFEILQNKIGNVVEDVGAKLLPIFLGLADFVTGTLVPAVADFTGPKGIGPLLDAVGTLAGKLGEFVGFLWGGGSGPLALALSGAAGLIGGLAGALGGVIDFVVSAIGWFGSLIDRVRTFLGLGGATSNAITRSGTGAPSAVRGRAGGGRVGADEWAWTGEEGPELIGPADRARVVIPAAQSRALAAPSGSPVVIRLELDGLTLAEVVDRQLFYALSAAAPGTSG